jgi:hypothetical protein
MFAEQYAFIDNTGKKVTPLYESGQYFHEDLAAVKRGGKWGYIDKACREVIPMKYDWAFGFSEGLALVARIEKNEKYGFIDKNGAEIN